MLNELRSTVQFSSHLQLRTSLFMLKCVLPSCSLCTSLSTLNCVFSSFVLNCALLSSRSTTCLFVRTHLHAFLPTAQRHASLSMLNCVLSFLVLDSTLMFSHLTACFTFFFPFHAWLHYLLLRDQLHIFISMPSSFLIPPHTTIMYSSPCAIAYLIPPCTYMHLYVQYCVHFYPLFPFAFNWRPF